HVCAIVDENQTRSLLKRLLDPKEFLSPHGIRSLSKSHEGNPFVFGERSVEYEPAEAVSKIKGGNSNWRGPVWFPTSFLMLESLRKLGTAYGPQLTVPAPEDEGGPPLTLREVAKNIANRMISIFTRDESGRRPVYGSIRTFQEDPHWRDLILFYEYFDGDTGAGLGASHQTGWTGLVASLIDAWREGTPAKEGRGLAHGKGADQCVTPAVRGHLGAGGLASATVSTRVAAQTPRRGGTLSLRTWDPPHFDHILAHAYKTHVVTSFTHNRLLRHKAGPNVRPGSLQIEGDLAESWQQTSDTTYVFKLRRGVRFHAKPPVNGRELIADDVRYTFEHILTEPDSANVSMFRAIGKIEAVDRYTVRFTLKEPFAWFLDMIANPMAGAIIARECVEKFGD